LELIQASTQSLRGAIDIDQKTFAYIIEVVTFKGFNSALQQQHFYENYLHTAKYPNATFTGKIIDPIDFKSHGTYQVRAKGTLEIHGKAKERIIPCEVLVEEGQVVVTSSFYVPLDDHNISIPKIVNQKIAEEILVEIEAYFAP
jgi:polyisoprenoid-binding protein YceI